MGRNTGDLQNPIEVFIYCAEEDLEYSKELRKRLSALRANLEIGYGGSVQAGQVKEQAFSDHLKRADIFLLLISPDFMASSDYDSVKIDQIMERRSKNGVEVLPIILRHSYQSENAFSNIQVLPSNGKPISVWNDHDEAWKDVVEGIYRAAIRIRTRRGDRDQQTAGYQVIPQDEGEETRTPLQATVAVSSSTGALSQAEQRENGARKSPLSTKKLPESILLQPDNSDPMGAKASQPKKTGRKWLNWRNFVILLLVLIIIASQFLPNIHSFLSRPSIPTKVPGCSQTQPKCPSGIGVTIFHDGIHDGMRIGLIVNDFADRPFDQFSSNVEEKNLETLVGGQNKSACSNSRHATLVVVTTLSRTGDDPNGSATVGLHNLEGAYIAQKLNNQNPANIPICLAIANLGITTTLKALEQVMRQIIEYSQYDKTVVGIVGIPHSLQMQDIVENLLQEWQQTNIPIVSPSATGNSLSDIKNFYRIDNPDKAQAEAMTQLICKYKEHWQDAKGAVKINVIFPVINTSLTPELGGMMRNTCGVSSVSNSYILGDTDSVRKAVNKALTEGYRLIYFAGFFSDIDVVESVIDARMLSKQDVEMPGITIFGGDGLYDFTNNEHKVVVPVYATVYTYPLKNDAEGVQAFIKAYKDAQIPVPILAESIPSYTLLPLDTIRTYNAMEDFIYALSNVNRQGFTQDDFNTKLAQAQFISLGYGFAFNGKNGTSSHRSDPSTSPPLSIMCIDTTQKIHFVAQYYYSSDSKPDKDSLKQVDEKAQVPDFCF